VNPIEKLAELFEAASRPVAFTGAGVSTESGIPDFRSPGGVWDRFSPIAYQDFLSNREARRETWLRGLHTYPVVAAAQPNSAHLAIAELERLGKLSCLITQNVDGLHQRAGSSSDLVLELHGNAHSVRCLDCRASYERAAIHRRVEQGETEPACAACGGQLKPATISFGEPLPLQAIVRAERAARDCDLFLVVGSSLVVYPAAGFPEMALQGGAPLAIINTTETHLDSYATVLLRSKAGEALSGLLDRLKQRLRA
jgi:NAD-dependent deacetylase